MGYELFVTRRQEVFDAGSEIPVAEWLSLVESDPELELVPEMGPYFARFLGACRYGDGNGWFDWSGGNVFTKNPDEALLSKLLAISESLGGRVAGEENETYTEPRLNTGVEKPFAGSKSRVSLIDKLISFLGKRRPRNDTVLPFDEGDRVSDIWGRVGTVKKIDRRAEHGMGRITVVYDDGREVAEAIVAHGFRSTDSASGRHD